MQTRNFGDGDIITRFYNIEAAELPYGKILLPLPLIPEVLIHEAGFQCLEHLYHHHHRLLATLPSKLGHDSDIPRAKPSQEYQELG